MDFLSKAFEKILSSLLVSFVLFFASFSYMTGHFPPRKSDMERTLSLSKQLFSSSQEYNEQAKKFQDPNQPPSLEQMVEFQRLTLKRAETTIELKNLFARLPKQLPSQEFANKLNKLQDQLSALEQGMMDVANELQQTAEAPQ